MPPCDSGSQSNAMISLLASPRIGRICEQSYDRCHSSTWLSLPDSAEDAVGLSCSQKLTPWASTRQPGFSIRTMEAKEGVQLVGLVVVVLESLQSTISTERTTKR